MHTAAATAKLVSVVSGLVISTWGAVALCGGRLMQCFLSDLLAHLPH